MGAIMVWIFGGAGFFSLLAFLWLIGDTWRTLLRDFPPSRRDDVLVFQAQHSSSHG